MSRLGQNLLSHLININDDFLFPLQSPNRTLSSLQLGFRFMVCQNIHLGCYGSWFGLKSGLFYPRLSQTLLCNSTKINNQLWFSIGSPNCSLSTFPGWVGGGGVGLVGGWGFGMKMCF